MRIERLPFTVYDVLGYFLPGVASFCILITLLFSSEARFLMNHEIIRSSFLFSLIGVFAFLIFSYLIGHCVALIASFTVEKICICFLGYPGKYMIEEYAYNRFQQQGDSIYNNCRIFLGRNRIFGFLVVVFCFPIALFLFLLAKMHMISELVFGLEETSRESLDRCFTKRMGKSIYKCRGREWFEIVNYFVYDNSNVSAHRMYNYLVLYGLMRNFCCVLLLCFYACGTVFFFGPIEIDFLESKSSQLDLEITESALLIGMICALILSALLACGYIKFNRRYTYEACMSFIQICRREDREIQMMERRIEADVEIARIESTKKT